MSVQSGLIGNYLYHSHIFLHGGDMKIFDYYAVGVFVICDELLKGLGMKDDSQAVMSNAEVATFSILAARKCYGNHRILVVGGKL